MEAQRSILVIGLLLVSFLLWMEYVDFSDPAKTVTQPSTEVGQIDSEQNFVPAQKTLSSQVLSSHRPMTQCLTKTCKRSNKIRV